MASENIEEIKDSERLAIRVLQLTEDKKTIQTGLTRHRRFIQSIILNNVTENHYEIEARLARLQDYLADFSNIIRQLKHYDKGGVDGYTAEEETFEDDYYRLVAKFKATLQKTTVQNNSITQAETNNTVVRRRSNYKLPEVKLPTFDGKLENWIQFRDLFDSMVIQSTDLMPPEKMHYLMSTLPEEMKRSFSKLDYSEEGFKAVWNELKERFDNKGALIDRHIQALFWQKQIQKDSPNDIRKLIDTFTVNLNQLQILGEAVDKWNMIIINMVKFRLDDDLKKAWQSRVIEIRKSNNKIEKLPTWKDMKSFLEEKCQILEQIQTQKRTTTNTNTPKINVQSKAPQSTRSLVVSSSTEPQSAEITIQCSICKQNHKTFKCPELAKLKSVEEKRAKVNEYKLCFNCLRKNHQRAQCKNKNTCMHCGDTHHSILCFKSNQQQSENAQSTDNKKPLTLKEITDTSSKQEQQTSVSSYCTWFNSGQKQVFLSTAIVNVEDIYGNLHPARVLLDSASESCLITQSLAETLRLRRSPVSVQVTGVNPIPINSTSIVNVRVLSRNKEFSKTFDLLVVPTISGVIPAGKVRINPNIKIPAHIQLADPLFNTPSKIDIIVGAEYFYDFILESKIKINQTNLVLRNSVFGWIVTGSHKQQQASVVHCNFNTLSDLHQQVQQFWEIDCYETKKFDQLTEEERFCENNFHETTYRNKEGRFVVTLPVRANVNQLSDNRNNALRRFHMLESKLKREPEKQQMYQQFMMEYENLQHMEKSTTNNDSNYPSYFLPHHPVIKPDSTTTRLRVVFDASSKAPPSNLSLNDVLCTGPNIQPNLNTQLIRARTYQIILNADIEKMYRQILVNPQQVQLQKVFWRNNINESIQSYNLLTLTYGTAPASFIATRCLKELARQYQQKYPEVAQIIENHFYMDDLITGCDSEERAMSLQNQLNEILSSAGFKLRKWLSNNPTVLQNIPEENKEKLSAKEFVKTLGILWHPATDKLSLNTKTFDTSNPVTKRTVLSESTQIFDPTGEFNPVIVRNKIFIQRIWELKLDWDSELSEQMQKEWNKHREELAELGNIKVDRFILIPGYIKLELHGFSDASEKAYGACIYIRSTDGKNNIRTSLLISRSKVAPLQKITLARLELNAAEVLATLFQKVTEEINLQFSRVILWSDSTIVLNWISNQPNRFNTYVANRVSRIQTITKNCEWRHIRSIQNPADLLSRGCSPEELIKSTIWWSGPQFLQQSEHNWPDPTFNVIENIPEIKATQIVSLSIHIEHNLIEEIIEKTNATRKVQKIIAYILRFIANSKCSRTQRTIGPLTVKELWNALKFIIRHLQQQCFSKEFKQLQSGTTIDIKSPLKNLNPFYDQQDMLLRVGGRLKNSDYAYSFKHQILLPNHTFIDNLIRDMHVENLHVGQRSLLSIVRHLFWPIHAKSKIRQICHRCITCATINPKTLQPFMGELPKERTSFVHPFLNVGVDYCGPIDIKISSARKSTTNKAYVAVFVCLAVKAIHLELVSDLSTEAFIACLDRFFSTRGLSSKIYSDNATNFIGTEREFNKISEVINTQQHNDKIHQHCANRLVEWIRIPPRAPSFGGIWESSVKLTKHFLIRYLKETRLTFEELYTVLKKIEAILNSRPLTPESLDPNDLRVLTPGHFLVGRALVSKPEENIAEVPMYRLTRWRRLQQITQSFWKRWTSEYISLLQQRVKNFKEQENIQIGDMVVIKDENPITLTWTIGRVINVIPGKDSIIRVVDVKLPNGIFRRPVNKLAKLPMDSNA